MLPVVPAQPQPRPLQPRILQEEAPVLGQPLVAEEVSVLQLARSVTGSVTPPVVWCGDQAATCISWLWGPSACRTDGPAWTPDTGQTL